MKKQTISGLVIVGSVFTGIGTAYLATWAILALCRVFPLFSPVSLIVFAVSFALFLVGVFCFIAFFRKQKEKDRLIAQGDHVWATVTEVRLNTNITYNGRHPHLILCSYEDMFGNLHSCKSESFLFPPDLVIDNDRIGVYVDRDEPSRYWVDITPKDNA